MNIQKRDLDDDLAQYQKQLIDKRLKAMAYLNKTEFEKSTKQFRKLKRELNQANQEHPLAVHLAKIEPKIASSQHNMLEVWKKVVADVSMAASVRSVSVTAKITGAQLIAKQCQQATSLMSWKEYQAVSRRQSKEMQIYWRKNEKLERDARLVAEKQQRERQRIEDEAREKKRQQQKLNFLITQSELYTQYVQNVAPVEAVAEQSVEPVDFADLSDEQVKNMAARQAQEAVQKQREVQQAFTGTLLPRTQLTAQPKMLLCTLKSYQLKGLEWLASLYEQGINGILADDMGLGKTAQSISLLCWLAEQKYVWGPFLVIAPASTLHNWKQEFEKFAPHMNVLPYWGTLKERKGMRRHWSNKIKYGKDTPYHVIITSYQLAVLDEPYLKRQKWQYMILDEAHAIKSSSSQRWNTLLSFHCRNRLLLTGTPIQNSMQELWALLHFIMPTIFDSHEEFATWFSKDIESHAVNQSTSKLDAEQLQKLHRILRPFMLRRVKSEVEHELGQKIEKTIYCDLTARQKRMYEALSQKVSIDALLEKNAMISESEKLDDSLMNAMMQMRKVCNHPQIFEKRDVISPFSFSPLYANGDLDYIAASQSQSLLSFDLPVLLFDQLFATPHIPSIWNELTKFDFLPLTDMSLSELVNEAKVDYLRVAIQEDKRMYERAKTMEVYEHYHPLQIFEYPQQRLQNKYAQSPVLQEMLSIKENNEFGLIHGAYIPQVIASMPQLNCSNSRVALMQPDPLLAAHVLGRQSLVEPLHDAVPEWPYQESNIEPLIKESAAIEVPNAKQLMFESGKLIALEQLLTELKQGGHKVLVYFQMTKMMELMEDFLNWKGYKYLRLDGQSKIEDRRDMVHQWQTDEDVFVFILSTRAGGLGINLTAADTVVFYDIDWNPSADSQAMDRAHRLGQTRQVTVYRLITKDTIEELILKRALQKDDIQKMVMQKEKV